MSECIKCGNLYFNHPDNGKGICVKCEMKEKDQTIAELKSHIKDMEQEQIAEMKEHEEFAEQAKNKIDELKKALELAVKDKCEFENMLLSTSLGIGKGKLAVPKKEQWYLEKAKEELNNDRQTKNN